MSEMRHRPRGGMVGIAPTEEELGALSDAMNSKYVDAYIPLPGVALEDQVTRIKECVEHETEIGYFERENGSHGWCCGRCGTVVQWG